MKLGRLVSGSILAVMFGLPGCKAGVPDRKKDIIGRQAMPALSFGLMDEDYWSQPRLNLKATQTKAKETDFLGILLEGPQVVDLERHSTLPLIGLRRATIEDNFHLRHDSHA
jgi:hypothetical protein